LEIKIIDILATKNRKTEMPAYNKQFYAIAGVTPQKVW